MRLKIVLAAVAVAGLGRMVQAEEWSNWRGPEQNGSTREFAVVTSWSQDGENLLWKAPYGGRTTPIVMHGRVFSIGPVGEGQSLQERVFCLDAQTGQLIWERRFNVFHTDIVENRVGWTALAGDYRTGHIFAHLSGGELVCMNGDGETKWKRSLTEEFGRISGYGGRLHNPVVDQDRVIISFLNSSWGSHSRPLHRYFAFDRRNGDVLWISAPGGAPLDTTYSTPVVQVVHGLRMLIAANADGHVYGLKARTGEPLWSFELSKRGLNSSVVMHGNHALVTHSEENIDSTRMGRAVAINAVLRGNITANGEVWRQDGVEAGYASPALANGRLYIVDNSANLHCFDVETGRKYWEYSLGRVGKGSPVVTADGVIYVGEQNGVFHILRDEGNKCVSLDREEFEGPEGTVDEIFGSPAVTGGRVYFMTRYNTYCLGKPDVFIPSVDIPPMPTERVVQKGRVERLEVQPAELTLGPGDDQDFAAAQLSPDTIYTYDPKNLVWTANGLNGTITQNGAFTAGDEAKFSAGEVKAATPAGLSGVARVRVMPKPPFTVDFEDMEERSVPAGWIAVSNRAQVEVRDGSKVLRKLASKERPSPPFMRLETFISPVLEGGHSVRADVMATEKKTSVLTHQADAGVINSRYRMSLLGKDQVLRIESWAAVPRIREDVPFEWKPEKWYRMRFDVQLVGDKARLLGKVWPRDEAEPEKWTIEVSDSHPNREGAAGLYGYSHGTTPKSDGTEVFFDNIQVIPND